MNTADKLRLLASALDRLLPAGNSVELSVRRYTDNPCINIHGVKSYEEAHQFFRDLGIRKWGKQVFSDELGPNGRTSLQGELDGIGVTIFCDGLPPSCRLEKFTERIPKAQTVETGDYVEIERTKIVCGHAETEAEV